MSELPAELYDRIIQEAQDAIIYADREGIIQLWNGGAETIFGFSAEEAIGKTMDLIIPERLRDRHWEGYHRVMATGVTKYGPGELLAVPALRKDGSSISLEFSIAMLRDGAGQVEGIVAILRDVTQRFQEDRALRKRVAELEAQLQASGAGNAGA